MKLNSMFLNLCCWGDAHVSPFLKKMNIFLSTCLTLTKENSIRQVLPDKNPFLLNNEKFQNTYDDDEDNENEDGDGDGVNGCKVGRYVSLVKKRKEHASTLGGDTSINKQKSKITAAQTNERVYVVILDFFLRFFQLVLHSSEF